MVGLKNYVKNSRRNFDAGGGKVIAIIVNYYPAISGYTLCLNVVST